MLSTSEPRYKALPPTLLVRFYLAVFATDPVQLQTTSDLLTDAVTSGDYLSDMATAFPSITGVEITEPIELKRGATIHISNIPASLSCILSLAIPVLSFHSPVDLDVCRGVLWIT